MAVHDAVGLSAGRYVMTNAAPTAGTMLDALAEVLDPVSMAVLEATGSLTAGARCLDLGAGLGSMAGLMAEQVAPGGEVYAVDLDTRHVEPHPGVIPWQADVTVAGSLPDDLFRVVHERLLLVHLPQRERILRVLVDRLEPAGLLVSSSWGRLGSPVMLTCPDPAGPDLYARYNGALVDVFAAAGNDPTWQTRVHAVMRDVGLVDVRTTVSAESYAGGTGACRLAVAVTLELRDKLIAAGMTGTELAHLRAILEDPGTTVLAGQLFTTTGWK